MKKNYILPAKFKIAGWILSIPFGIICILSLIGVFKTSIDTFMNNFGIIGFTITLLLVAFSREKEEDECISSIRLKSLIWSMLINYTLLIVATVFLYGFAYLNYIFINIFLILILFIAKFQWSIYQFRKESHE